MTSFPALPKLANIQQHRFEKPAKKIYDGADVSFFLTSLAYRDIITFMLQLNRSVLPRKIHSDETTAISTWPLDSSEQVIYSDPISRLRAMLEKLSKLVDEVPPDTGPRRFGNVSFRKWHKLVEDQVDDLLDEAIDREDLKPAYEELAAYLLGSFGSAQRLDYGTGHELSFLAFLACLWKLSFFPQSDDTGVAERAIVLGVFEPYLDLIRKVIKLYNLEPAGSHGVWGLDDNSFLPYIFGSAQLCPAIDENDETPTEGSLPNAPDPSSVAKQNLVDKEKGTNMYFAAIAFIHDVKRGPFWEHSPMLYDISGIKDGWGKINKGMIKMYNAEVLSKFPVVQHFPFGSLFQWQKDPEARPPPVTTHTASQPLRTPLGDAHAPSAASARPGGPQPATAGVGTRTAAPWAGGGAQPSSRSVGPPKGFVNGVTQAPWARPGRGPAPPPPPPSTFRTGLNQHPPRPQAVMPSLNENDTKATQESSSENK